MIEVSLVVVIMGLIVGGIIAGDHLRKSAKVKKQIQQLNDLTVAYNTFKMQYDAMPGDMKDANAYWSAAIPGNGNGQMESAFADVTSFSRFTCDNINSGEQAEFFTQLQRAELIADAGVFPGFPGFYPINYDPSTAMTACGCIEHCTTNVFTEMQWPGQDVFVKLMFALQMGKTDPTTFFNYRNDIGIFTSYDAYTVDTKMDDGKPKHGNVLGWKGFISQNCLTDSTMDAGYDLSRPEANCLIGFILEK